MYRSRGGEGEGAARCSSDVLLTNNSSEPVHVPALLDPRLGSERRAVTPGLVSVCTTSTILDL